MSPVPWKYTYFFTVIRLGANFHTSSRSSMMQTIESPQGKRFLEGSVSEPPVQFTERSRLPSLCDQQAGDPSEPEAKGKAFWLRCEPCAETVTQTVTVPHCPILLNAGGCRLCFTAGA